MEQRIKEMIYTMVLRIKMVCTIVHRITETICTKIQRINEMACTMAQRIKIWYVTWSRG